MVLTDFTDKLVSITDLSNGKAGKICTDVAENHTEYVILRNNRPTAVIISLDEYREVSEKARQLEKLLDEIETASLLKLAESRKNSATTSFESLVAEEGMTMEDVEALEAGVEIE